MVKTLFIVFTLFTFTTNIFAINADEIAKKSYKINHSMNVKNMMIKKKGRIGIISINRVPNVTPRITIFERFLSNEYTKSVIEAKDLVIIRSGKLNGMGILMTSYLNPNRSHEYLMWLPALRKVRRMAEPKDAGMSAGDIAFLEDAKLRRLHEEKYVLLDTKVMNLKLEMMPFVKKEFGRHTKLLPKQKSAMVKNRKVHVLKSIYKAKEHWYDYRISHIDSEYFTDYYTEYFKHGKRIKKVYRHWINLPTSTDTKSKMWNYWYSIDTKTGNELITYIPTSLIKINKKVKKSFWSTQTLQKIKR